MADSVLDHAAVWGHPGSEHQHCMCSHLPAVQELPPYQCGSWQATWHYNLQVSRILYFEVHAYILKCVCVRT